MGENRIHAERWRTTKSQRKQMQRKTLRNKRYRKVPVEITQQPEKTRKVYHGRVTFEYKSGPRSGEKVSVPITLKEKARLSIRGKDLMVKPLSGPAYVWGEASEKDEEKDLQVAEIDKKTPERLSVEKRFRDRIQEKLDEFLEERGPTEAGKAMATCFIIAHNKMKKKLARKALAKVYGSVMRGNKGAHRAFSRHLRSSSSVPTIPKEVDTKGKGPKGLAMRASMNDETKIVIATKLVEAAEALDKLSADKKTEKAYQAHKRRVDSLVKNLQKMLERHSKKAKTVDFDVAHVGDVGHVAEELDVLLNMLDERE